MRTKLSILFVLLVTAALLSACGTTAFSGQQPRLLSVNGRAEVKITPDLAYISIGVHTEDTTAAEAVAMNNSQAQAVINALKELGIAEADIQTTNFSIYPYEKWGSDNQSLGIYYSVDNTVYVTLRDVDSLGSAHRCSHRRRRHQRLGDQLRCRGQRSAASPKVVSWL